VLGGFLLVHVAEYLKFGFALGDAISHAADDREP
jgi:hypothetical protein